MKHFHYYKYRHELKCLIHNLLYCPQAIFSSQVNCKGAWLNNVHFHLASTSHVDIRNCIIRDSQILMLNEGCSLRLGNGCRVKNVRFYCEDKNSSIESLTKLTIGGGEIASTEGCNIKIGNDCMFSNDIEIRNGDSHSIVSEDDHNHRINPAKDIIIGNHVWLTAHVRILKGSIIPDNCIIANSAIVSHPLEKKNSIYGGNPIKLLKQDIYWKRER